MAQVGRAAPPTARQVAAMQALMLHRTQAAAARSLGLSRSVVSRSIDGCIRRAANIDGWALRPAR